MGLGPLAWPSPLSWGPTPPAKLWVGQTDPDRPHFLSLLSLASSPANPNRPRRRSTILAATGDLRRRHWYVSNVSIIFDAPCLFLHHLLSVSLHFMAFYAFSRTNLLTRCHSASSLFSTVFVFQKSYTWNILGIGRNKSQTSRNSPKLPENRRGDGVGPQGAHTTGRHGPGLGRAPYVCGHLGPLLTMPLRL
jgi:hypothetical protein